jgi:hypothetical protein
MQEIINALSTYFASVAALVAGIIVISELLNKVTKLNGVMAWIQSWVVSIAACLFGAGFDIGIFYDQSTMPWYWEGVVSGIIIGLAANGIFSVPGVTNVLEMLKIREKPTPQ